MALLTEYEQPLPKTFYVDGYIAFYISISGGHLHPLLEAATYRVDKTRT
jgi:hypothetical protein